MLRQVPSDAVLVKPFAVGLTCTVSLLQKAATCVMSTRQLSEHMRQLTWPDADHAVDHG